MSDNQRADVSEEDLAFLRSRKCRCCRQWVTNCVCFGSYMLAADGTSTTTACTPASHGKDGYDW